MKTIIISDVDGTLITKSLQVPLFTREVIQQFQKEGNTYILASGRSYHALQFFAETLGLHTYGGLAFSYNGCLVYDYASKKVLYEYVLENYTEIITTLQQHNIDFAVYSDDTVYASALNKRLTPGYFSEYKNIYSTVTYYQITDWSNFSAKVHKIGVALESEEQYVLYKDIFLHYGFERVHAGWCEVYNKQGGKGNAIDTYVARNGIEASQVYIFGDGENDISMLSLNKYNTIAMSNGFVHVKKVANQICDNVQYEGQAKYIATNLLRTKKNIYSA